MAASAVPGLDLPRLQEFVTHSLPGVLRGPLSAELLAGGRSNLTYVLTDDHLRWVLRRPPLGHVLATAHDMVREHRVISALAGTDVPVPRPVLLADAAILGAPFYIMEFVDGAVLRDATDLERLTVEESLRLGRELIDVLGRLHALDASEVGLAGLGRPEGYLERQLDRWARQLEASHSRDLPPLTSLANRLASGLPSRRFTSLVHGDYRLDNVVVSPTHQISAVLDWEMATQGDPLADLASTVVWWDGLKGLDSPVAAVPGDITGFPSSTDLVQTYAQTTGRDVDALPWYVGFAFYKIAAIFEGIHFRAQQGLTVGEGFDLLGALVPHLAERGHEALNGITTT